VSDATSGIGRSQRVASLNLAEASEASRVVIQVHATNGSIASIDSAVPVISADTVVRCKYTQASVCVARVVGTVDIIVTVDFNVIAQTITTAGINGARVAVVAVSVVGDVGASGLANGV